MVPLITVVTDDDYLWQKIYLTLRSAYSVERVKEPEKYANNVCILDTRADYSGKLTDKTAVLGVDIPLPFTYRQLTDAIGKLGEGSGKIMTRGDRCVYLRGERIALTDVERSLLDVLIDANGKYVSRDEIMERVWHGEAENGVLNVYIHYLRNKLEKGEKIILSSRSLGYKIDEKYI